MAEKISVLSTFRIRCKSGDMIGAWLWKMSVSKGGMRMVPFNWEGILQDFSQYTFHPKFLQDESAAYRTVSRVVAEGFVRVLASVAIDAEIVAEQPKQRQVD